MILLLNFALIVIILQVIVFLLPGKLANIVEVIFVITTAFFLFKFLDISEALISISILAVVYLNMSQLLSKEDQKIRKAVKPKLQSDQVERIELRKQKRRIWHDLIIATFLAGTFVAVLVFAKENVGPAKILIIFAFIYLLENMVRRIIYYYTVRFYYDQETEALYVVTLLHVKKFPLRDLQEFKQETRPDILKLFPLFQLFSDREDYTTAEARTFKLTFPSQIIYFNPKNTSKYQEILQLQEKVKFAEKPEEVLPFWHPT